MNQHLHCIALRRTPVSDSRYLLTAWSRELGRITFAFPAGAGREARRRLALSSPLALFEGRSEIKPGQEIAAIRDFSPSPGSPAMSAPDFARTMLASFLAEVLDRVLLRAAPDEALSDFLFDSIRTLANADSKQLANFHLVFLYGLTCATGIEPDLSDYSPNAIFDMRDARFRTAVPQHPDFIANPENRLIPILAHANYTNVAHIHLTREQRQQALAKIIDYLSLHLANLSNLRSLSVITTLT